MRFQQLSDWLTWQETLHPREIDLGLERCDSVAERMGLSGRMFPIVTVAGTNGKGSSVAMLEAILAAEGYRVGAYTSPHLVRYNERVRVQGAEVSDEVLMHAFDRIDEVRGAVSLTYFEFGTLAAMDIFRRAGVDVAILEVGLGGRLDAVNLFDADVALVTTVDIDHVDWLGEDREAIGREKAGIFRRSRPAVYGDPRPPDSVKAYADELGTHLYCLHEEFSYGTDGEAWRWTAGSTRLQDLPKLPVAGAFQYQNAAAVLMVLQLMREHELSVGSDAIRRGLREVRIRGRFEVRNGTRQCILDVAHNVQAAKSLAATLSQTTCIGRTLAVFTIMADKDVHGVLAAMGNVVNGWHVAQLREARSASSQLIRETLSAVSPKSPVDVHSSVLEAYVSALNEAAEQDRIVVFGSFYAVGEILSFDKGVAVRHDVH